MIYLMSYIVLGLVTFIYVLWDEFACGEDVTAKRLLLMTVVVNLLWPVVVVSEISRLNFWNKVIIKGKKK